MQCEFCPLKNTTCQSQCIADRFSVSNLCNHMDPSSPTYNYAYAQLIIDQSCGTHEYKFTGVSPGTGIVSPVASGDAGMRTMPSTWQMLKNLTGSMVKHAKSGFKNVPQEVYDERMNICLQCDHLDKSSERCDLCGCFMRRKNWLSTTECPLKKYGQYNEQSQPME